MNLRDNLAKLTVIIFLAALLSSCTAIQGGIGKKPVTEEDLRKGTEALSMSFLENMPPAQVFSAEDTSAESGLFQLGLKLANKGATDIERGMIALSLETGYVNDVKNKWKSSDSSLSDKYDGNFVTFQIAGKSPENPAGDTITFSKVLQAAIPATDKESQKRKSTIIATACYDYKTRKTVSICVDPKPFAERVGPKPCDVKDITFDSQGAPLAITKISPRMVLRGGGTSIEFVIYIKNKGNGQIIPSNKIIEACNPKGGDKTFWGSIKEEDLKLEFSTEEGGFKCSPFPMKLRGGDEDYLRCIYESAILGEQAYTTTLNIEFDYGYTHSVSKDITIERPPEVVSQ